jgi:hypothetical protein
MAVGFGAALQMRMVFDFFFLLLIIKGASTLWLGYH